jgi:1,2-diacylglycerol-3-alpha-glucose alpha-1,2-glucosyltransferase
MKNEKKLKVCLYIEDYNILSVSGMGNAMKHHIRALELNNIECTFDPTKFDYDILHLDYCGLKCNRYARLAKKKGIKVVISTHVTAEDFKDTIMFSNQLASALKLWLKIFYSKADLLISPSSYTRNLLKTKYKLKNKIIVISNGIDTELFKNDSKKAEKFKKKYNVKSPLVMGLGLVLKRKGISDFIKVSKQFDNSFFWVGSYYGAISGRRNINQDIKNASENFKLTGYVEDIIGAYSACDIFFFPSYEENEGIVILEAASMGKAIVVRDIPVFRSYLSDKKNCLMANSNKDFERIINKLSKDSKLRERLGKEARKLAINKDLRKVGFELKKNYLDLLNRE